MAIPIRAVIFDYGKVLCFPPTPETFARPAHVLGVDPDRYSAAYWRYRDDYDRALLDPSSYWANVTSALGVSLDGNAGVLITLDNENWLTIDHRIVNWALALKKHGVRIAVLSNMQTNLLQHLRRDFRWLPQFDALTFSCELGVVKPSPEIYQHCLQQLGVAPEAALFLDDKLPNIEGARRLGIHAIEYTTPDALLQQLGAYDLPVLP